MTRSGGNIVALGPLRRAGAALLLLVAILSGLTACVTPDQSASPELTAVYEHARGLTEQQTERQLILDEAVLDWAVELGISDGFSRDQLADPEADVYGARDVGIWEQYRDHVERLSQGIRDHIRDGLDVDAVQEYYQQHPEDFARQDEMTLEITEWEGDRAVSTYTVEVDETTVRSLQERDDLLMSAALPLQQDEQLNVDRGADRIAQVRCVSRWDAGAVPFDEVVQAAAGQLAAELFDAELDDRIAVSVNARQREAN